MRKRLILDMDDVLFPLLDVWLEKYNNIWEDTLKPEDITDWDISKFVKKECGRKVYDLLKPTVDYSLWDLEALPVPKAVEIVSSLNNLMDVFIVSSVSNDYTICQFKHDWLLYYFPFLDIERFYFVSDKNAVSGDYMVDDYYVNLQNFNGRRILFDRPHNQSVTVKDGYDFRAYGWEEVYKIIMSDL